MKMSQCGSCHLAPWGRRLGQNPPSPPCQGGTSPSTLILPPSKGEEIRRDYFRSMSMKTSVQRELAVMLNTPAVAEAIAQAMANDDALNATKMTL